MNSFGKNFRVTIFGESHGPAVGLVVDGCPPGIAISATDFEEALLRRRGGNKPGTTPRSEADIPDVVSGYFNGYTTGAPLTILFHNKDVRSKDYESLRQTPRPGHADWVAEQKYSGFQDYRGGGHFSGRLTVCLVAAGVLAAKVISRLNNTGRDIIFRSRILEVGGQPDIEQAIVKAMEENDSVGGIVECEVSGLPVGLGEPFFNSVESLISHAVFSIPAIKGIEFGSGFAAAKMTGSVHNDAIMDASGRTATNHAGGISGGISNGNDLVFRVAVKPTSSTPKEQLTYHSGTGKQEPLVIPGRHDLCIALRVPVVLESVTQMVIADLLMEKQIIP